jgi:hypothetical protein
MISQRYARMRVDRAKICGASTRAVSKRGDRQEGCYLYILLPNESDATRRYIIITIAAPHGYAYYSCSLVTSPLPGSDSHKLTDLKLNCSYLVLYSQSPH